MLVQPRQQNPVRAKRICVCCCCAALWCAVLLCALCTVYVLPLRCCHMGLGEFGLLSSSSAAAAAATAVSVVFPFDFFLC